MSNKGKIIVIDGMDGTGKHTQSTLLYKNLKKQGKDVYLFSFPNYESDSSFFIKKLLNKEFDDISNPYFNTMLYSLDRYITYAREIKENYENGAIIILDRYYISNILYQLSKDMDYDSVIAFIKIVKFIEVTILDLPVPDCTVILTSKPEVSNKLLNNRYNDDDSKRDIYENIDKQNEVYNNIKFIDKYKRIISHDTGEVHILYIHDEEGNIYSIEDINKKIIDIIE